MSRSRKPTRMIHVDCDQIRKLLDISRSISSMTDRVRTMISGPESQHVQSVTPSKSGVIVWTDSPTWASRLRFHVPALTHRLKQCDGFAGVEHVAIRVLPAEAPQPEAKRQVAMSMQSAETLWVCANHVSDPELSDALRRLAAHVNEGEENPVT